MSCNHQSVNGRDKESKYPSKKTNKVYGFAEKTKCVKECGRVPHGMVVQKLSYRHGKCQPNFIIRDALLEDQKKRCASF